MQVSAGTSLRGYSLPLSPSGGSAMVPAPPWHFAGDAVWVTYRADPQAVAQLLPPGLRPAPGAGAAMGCYDWQWCTDGGAELLDPVRAQFRECVIALDCTLDGEPVARVPYAWVDSAVPLLRGFIQGMPKLPGSVAMTRAFPIGRAGPRRAAGGRFGATVSAYGRRIATAEVTLAEPCAAAPPLSDRPLIHTRHFPSWHPGEPDLTELVRAVTEDTAFSGIWRGSARLAFHDVDDPDLARLAPVEVLAGFVFTYAETLRPGHRVTPVDGAGTPG